jgi:hypothetical protein
MVVEVVRKYVYLASNSYSGSTLLSYLLGVHPEIGTVSDVSGTRRTGEMDSYRCSCGRLMRECPFWDAIRSQALERGLGDFDLGDFRLGFDHAGPAWASRIQGRSLRWSWLEDFRDVALRPFGMSAAIQQMGERNWLFAQLVLDVVNAHVFVDASKERLRIRHLARSLPAALYVIHLTRDVRGVVDSTLRRGKVPLSAPLVAKRWASTNAAILRQLRLVPSDRQLRVRYEDLCADVDGTLKRAFEFCGVDPGFEIESSRAELHLLGNKMRLAGVESVQLNEQWRDRLARKVQDEILAAAAPTFQLLYADAQMDTRQ